MTAPAPRRRLRLARIAHSPPSPHLTGGQVVGPYVHAYDAPSPPPYPSRVPAMRPSREAAHRRRSATPIYDALCVEFKKAFRTLPGDRTGEADLAFTGFGDLGAEPGRHRGLAAPGGYGEAGSSTGRHAGDRPGNWEPAERTRRASPPPALPPAPGDEQAGGY
ncbi:hypothetical protein RKE29_23165 [Streptomyces sp. B1866]|uniref:hypothetical protein n=1 Tax=Streptomyces sp. B1866 TaxID=3075431 RepID=UPI00288CA22B|nr:hypothetical protein [Streptomyces sp. B1866]MDT3399511.1 hypothetical protein [Streptomyces sp. B1866]